MLWKIRLFKFLRYIELFITGMRTYTNEKKLEHSFLVVIAIKLYT